MHSSLITTVFLQGREPVLHSQATSNCYQWSLCTGHLICPHFQPSSTFLCHPPRTCSSALPLEPCSFYWSGWNQTKLGTVRKKCHLNLRSHYCCELIWKYFGTILFTEQMLTYLRYIFSMPIFVLLFVVVLFKWPHSCLHLKNRWIKMVKENIVTHLCCSCCLFIVKMTVRNLFCCHRTVEECTVEDFCISPVLMINCGTQCQC